MKMNILFPFKIEENKRIINEYGEIETIYGIEYDFLGKYVVLFFYPLDFTFVCPTELEEAANYYEEFQKLNDISIKKSFIQFQQIVATA